MQEINVTKGDLIEIPCKNKYTYSGKLRMLEVQNNPFDENETHEKTDVFVCFGIADDGIIF